MFNIIKNLRYKTPYIKNTKINLLDFHGSYSSRNGNKIKFIVWHWAGEPAGQNNDFVFRYFNSKNGEGKSSHFCTDQDGNISQFVPLSMTSYAAGDWQTNQECINVEANTMISGPNIPKGSYTVKSYESQVELAAALLLMHNLTIDSLIRHYDVTGKDCPRLFFDFPHLWDSFKKNVSIKMTELKFYKKKLNYFVA